MGHSYEDGWNTKPKLDEARFLAPDETKPAPGRKDRRRWCRGKVGVEHVTEICVPKNRYNVDWNRKCGWSHWRRGPHWSCIHVVQCVNCGKQLEHYLGRKCPDWYPCSELPRVRIDLNVRTHGNWTFTRMKNADRMLRIGDQVEVYEEESGIYGPGKVMDIALPKFGRGRTAWPNRLVYIAVEWKKMRAPEDD